MEVSKLIGYTSRNAGVQALACSFRVVGGRARTRNGRAKARTPEHVLQPVVSIIIPVHDQAELTLACLETLAANTMGVPFEAIVVDNASADGTRRLLEAAPAWVRVVRNEVNRRFGPACNQGAGLGRGRYLLFLNNDTEVQPGWLSPLVARLESDPAIGVVGARLVYPDGALQHAGIVFGPNLLPTHRAEGARLGDPTLLVVAEVPAVTGACLLTPATLFRQVGGFDEGYELYFEDADFCLRIRQAGRRIVYCPESLVVHLTSRTALASAAEARAMQQRSAARFAARWGPFIQTGLGTWAAGPIPYAPPLLPAPGEKGKRGKGEGGKRGRGTGEMDSDFAQVHGVRTGSALRAGWRPAPLELGPFRVVWEGSQFVRHSLALVNRELGLAVLGTGRVDLSLIPFERHEFDEAEDARFLRLSARFHRPLRGPAEFHVRHRWPPSFDPVPAGRFVLIQPWEYGRLPRGWVDPIQERVVEVWAYSEHVRRCYVESGIPSDRVHVIPLAVNHAAFHPGAAPLRLPTRKAFKYLFVGGTLWRKGIDLLLAAYRQAFSRRDDVCLVIKDMLTDGVYKGHTAGAEIGRLLADPAAPEVIYLTAPMRDPQMPGLYAACDCLVHPYRAEGFALPVAEAMACGRPVILTQGGACDDFCTDDAVYWLPAARREVQVEGVETAGPAWVLEPSVDALVAQLRLAYERRDDCRERGQRAQARVRERLSWERSASLVLERLEALRQAQESV